MTMEKEDCKNVVNKKFHGRLPCWFLILQRAQLAPVIGGTVN